MSLPPLPRDLRLRSLRLALAVAAVTGVALCLASPVVGIPGLESALVLGLVLPPFVALTCARRVVEYRRSGRPLEAPEILGAAAIIALGVLAVPVLLLLLNLLRVPACEPLAGLAFLALGPALGVLLGALVGTGLALLGGRGQLASTLAFSLPWVAALLGVVQFWSGPAIFVYGHFGGYFPGTLYDPDVEVTGVYVAFRLVTLAWLLGLAALVVAGLEPEAGRLRLSRMRRHPGWVVLAVLLLGAAITGDLLGESLGHRSSAASIAEALGGRVDGERCVVLLPREMPRRDAVRLAADCDHRVRQAERALGVTQPRPVTAYFFRDTGEKRRLMGASRTQVAKPWRHEVYLQLSEWPHPILFHEVVHVVVGNVGRGPFRVSGAFGGWLPDPAIIEGVAVALAWDAREGLTPHQWARAMLDGGLAPPLRNVGGLSFLLQPASRAYVASGSFVRWMRETRGPASVRQLYLTGDWEHALGTTVAEAEREWHRYLREEVELPAEARALARLRFERPGIFSQTCPHRVANLQTELRAALGAGDDVRAARTCRRILRIDPNHTSTRANLVGTLARLGRQDAAREELARLVGPPSAAPPLVAAARLRLADALWRRGRAGRGRRALPRAAHRAADRRQRAPDRGAPPRPRRRRSRRSRASRPAGAAPRPPGGCRRGHVPDRRAEPRPQRRPRRVPRRPAAHGPSALRPRAAAAAAGRRAGPADGTPPP